MENSNNKIVFIAVFGLVGLVIAYLVVLAQKQQKQLDGLVTSLAFAGTSDQINAETEQNRFMAKEPIGFKTASSTEDESFYEEKV